MQQRLHEYDLIGQLIEAGGFELLSFPAVAQEDEVHVISTPFGTLRHARKEGEALHPEREPLEVLARQRVLLGEEQFDAQYLQSPTPPGGSIVKIDHFMSYEPGHEPEFWMKLQSWDTASKANSSSDYSVCTTWGLADNGRIYLLHVFRERLEYPELKRKIVELARQFRVSNVIIEDSASGTQLIQELTLLEFARIIDRKHKAPKDVRMRNQTATIEANLVFVPAQAPWRYAYLDELRKFPKGKHDDQVDSTSQALEWIAESRGPEQFLKMLDEVYAEREGFTDDSDAEYTVCFDHPVQGIEFKVMTGRLVLRAPDGYFHVSPDEWQSIPFSAPDATLIHHPDHRA